jgi:hypothetical protein
LREREQSICEEEAIIYDPRLASPQKDVKITRMLLPRRKDDNINDDGEDDFADGVENDPIIRKLTAQHGYAYVTPLQACMPLLPRQSQKRETIGGRPNYGPAWDVTIMDKEQ